MSLNNANYANNVDFKKAGYTHSEAQERLSEGNSLLKKYFTKDFFEKHKNIQTHIGTSLHDIIKSGLAHPTSKIGIYAGDAESYTTFSDLFVPIIEEFHKVTPTTVYKGELNAIKLDLNLEGAKYNDIRIRMGANLEAPFTSKQTLADRQNVETQVSQTLLSTFGGKYIPAPTKESSDAEKQQWADFQDKGWGFPLEDEYLVDAGIITDFWPKGSGIWLDDATNPTVIIIINEEDHIRFTGFNPDMQVVYDKVSAVYNALDKKLKFAKSEKYGNLGSCPSNIGHMFKSGIRISFPQLQKNHSIEELRAIAKEYGCEIRGKGGESSKTFDVMEISNSVRFMSPQEAVIKWATLLNRFATCERNGGILA